MITFLIAACVIVALCLGGGLAAIALLLLAMYLCVAQLTTDAPAKPATVQQRECAAPTQQQEGGK